MSIIDEYNRQMLQRHYDADPAQAEAVDQLSRLQHKLRHYYLQQQTLRYKMLRLLNRTPAPPDGIYLWGDVGRGKTWLMDMFYDTLQDSSIGFHRKIRMHFHHFMRAIHDQLSLLEQQKNPLQSIARAFARKYRLICLDEFHVSDITDAMLLYGLLNTLFKEGVVIVATSNIPPDDLYKNGLQRERFIPAIALIKQSCQTLQLNGQVDHRLRLLEQADIWYLHSEHSHKQLEQCFLALATSPAQRAQKIHINYRQISSIMVSSDIIWLDFQSLCGDQRGSADYIEIARQYHTVIVSQIPVMNDSHNDVAKRFINMIDEYYDRNVKIIASAEDQPENLYNGKQLHFEFKRTVSRLLEMRSHNYMQQAHKCN